MIYDALVAIAIGMCAAMVAIVVLILLMENGVVSMSGYSHASEAIQHSSLYTTVIQVWVGLWMVGFYVYFWRHGGQTIGMRAWRLRLFSTSDAPLGYGRVIVRLLSSLGGLGTLLVLFDVKHRQGLQDHIAKTQMCVLTKDANHHRAWKDL